MNRMQDKVAVITGGAGGIGASTARLMKSHGAEVVICDLPASDGEKIAGDLGTAFHALDVSREEQWARCICGIEQRFGRIDVLVNGAGIEGDLNEGAPDAMSLSQWRKVMSVNLDGTFLGCREVLPVMRRRQRGSIINIASIASYYPTVQNAAYGASKAGVTQLTKSVAAQGALDGNRIRCNSIHPGLIETRMLGRIFGTLKQRGGDEPRSRADEFKSRIPLGGSGQPEDIANLAMFLACDESRYITGAEFLVDGGWRLLR